MKTVAMRKAAKAKANGNGKGKKKKSSKFPVTKGKINIYSTEGKKIKTLSQSQYDALDKSGRGFKSGQAKKVPGGYMYIKSTGGSSSAKSIDSPYGSRHQSEIKRKKAAKKY
jgi:hypothetical protein